MFAKVVLSLNDKSEISLSTAWSTVIGGFEGRIEEHYELLAYHYGRSASADKAAHYLDLANRKAIKLYAIEDAKAYFDEAMAHLDTLPESEENRQRRISLLVNQGEVFLLLSKTPEYYDLLTRHEPIAIEL